MDSIESNLSDPRLLSSQALNSYNQNPPTSHQTLASCSPTFQPPSQTVDSSANGHEYNHINGAKVNHVADSNNVNNNFSSKPEIQKPLLSENGLTNTHSGTTERDGSGGEEETSSRRRRRSRWDPPSDSNNQSGNDQTSSGAKKRKSRWADDEPKPVIQLPDFMKDFTGGLMFVGALVNLISYLLS